MMRQNLNVLQTVMRNLRRHSTSTSTSTSTTILGRKRSSFLNQHASSYQQFDAPESSQHQRNFHRNASTNPTNPLQRFARKLMPARQQSSTFQLSRRRQSTASNTSSSISKCWHCSVPLPGDSAAILCPECNTIQPLPETTGDQYFRLFNLPPASFAIDTVALQRSFRQLQSLCHPDKFAQRSEREQQLSADWSALVNAAYKTLVAPIRRGEYMLRKHGIEVPEANTAVGTEFLMEMMERNEEVDDASEGAELLELLARVREDLERVVGRLDAALRTEEQLEGALEVVIELRYLVSLESSIKAKCARLGVVA